MAIDNLPVSSIPDFSRFLERNVQHPPGITRTQTPNTGHGNGGKGRQSLVLCFSLSSGRRKGQRIGRKGKKEGDWDSLSSFFPSPLPFLRLPGRLYFRIQPLIMLGEHLNWDMVGSKTCTLTMWLNPREWTKMFSCLLL